MFSAGYEKMAAQKMGGGGKGRKGGGRAVSLRARTPGSVEHGGNTGHYAGAHGGPHAATPHSGAHTMRGMGSPPRPGSEGPHGYQGGPHPAQPHNGQLARATGYKGTHGDYAAAGPLQGFVTGGRGGGTGGGRGRVSGGQTRMMQRTGSPATRRRGRVPHPGGGMVVRSEQPLHGGMY